MKLKSILFYLIIPTCLKFGDWVTTVIGLSLDERHSGGRVIIESNPLLAPIFQCNIFAALAVMICIGVIAQLSMLGIAFYIEKIVNKGYSKYLHLMPITVNSYIIGAGLWYVITNTMLVLA